MYILERKKNVYVAYRDVLEQKFNTLEELIDYCYEHKLFNKEVKKEKLKTEIDVDWYLTDLVTKKIENN